MATIANQIQRIEEARDTLRTKGIDMGLEVPAGQYEQGTFTKQTLNSNDQLDKIAAAFNAIPIQTNGSITLNAGESFQVLKGYNKENYEIIATSLSDSTNSGNAEPEDILEGKIAWAEGREIKGIMSDLSEDQETDVFDSYTSNSKQYLYVQIPQTGKYTDQTKLKSKIPYYTRQDTTIPITIKTTDNGEILVTSTYTIKAGYYSHDFSIEAVHDKTGDNTPKVINIANSVGQLDAIEGNLSIPLNFDYFSPTASYTIKEGSLSQLHLDGDDATGEVSVVGNVTEGWIKVDSKIKSVYTPPVATFKSADVTGKVQVNSAGWVSEGTEIGGLTTESEVSISKIQSNQNGTFSIKATATPGYIASQTTRTTILNPAQYDLHTTSSADSNAQEIASQYFYTEVSEGYTTGIETYYKIKQGNVSQPTIENKQVQVTVTEGWVPNTTITYEGSTPTYVMDLTEPISFTVQDADDALMQSVTINTSAIYNRLAAI